MSSQISAAPPTLPILPALAAIGRACYNCHSRPAESVQLQRCSKCCLVFYCSLACQKNDWAYHKALCRLLAEHEKYLAQELANDPGRQRSVDFFQRAPIKYISRLKREMSERECALLRFEPRCLECRRTRQQTRLEASVNPSLPLKLLIPCSDCQLSFACEDHWPHVRWEHTQAKCEGGPDGLSQCVLNRELLENEECFSKMLRMPELLLLYGQAHMTYRWVAPRTETSWKALEGVTWNDRFRSQLEAEFPLARGSASAVWMRLMSDALSMPMTALYVLEQFNVDRDWSTKSVLTIHVVGAQGKEFRNACCFENILHQLPEVKTLHVVFCGTRLKIPLSQIGRGPHIPMTCCLDCQRRGREIYIEGHDIEYYLLPTALGSTYTIPDLAIVYDPPELTAEERGLWKLTIEFLVSRNIPSVFTVFTHAESTGVNRLMLNAGVRLVPALGPCRNPWGSLLLKKDSELLHSFYSDNMYFAGGFKGR
ncbi:hypothetical protein B0H11DRAFT_2275425 [Mycena galericulata]|nr:hypothetical protein B0H11DRAFT_2275425 [Mycena galericulata]